MAKFVKTLHVKSAADVPVDVQPGQWVRVGKEKRSRQLVSSTNFGVVMVKAPRNGTCSRAAMRLARDKGKTVVLGVSTRD